MKKLISVILLSAMLLTACGKEGASGETAASETTAVTTYAEVTTAKTAEEEIQIDEEFIPKDEVGQALLDYALADYISDDANPVTLKGESAEKLEEAFRNIRINNSRFALPLMVGTLPDEFTVEYDYSSEDIMEEWGFNYYNGEIFCDNELCAQIGIIRKNNAEEKYGIIVSLVLISNQCKWDFDGIEYSNESDKITEKFGDPSFVTDIVGAPDSNNMAYVSDIGSTAIFWEEINAVFCMNFNFGNVIKNASLVEYVPYDDFDNAIEIPELSGEPRNIDWNMLFEDDCIIIGNDKYPAYMKVSDFSEDIKLYEYNMENKYEKNSDYLRDGYLLMYKGREIGLISAIRKKEEKPEEAYIFSWMFTDISSYPFPASAMGIPFNQTLDAKNYYTGFEEENETFRYRGVVENENDKFLCILVPLSNTMLVNLTPYSADPEAYDNFVNSQ